MIGPLRSLVNLRKLTYLFGYPTPVACQQMTVWCQWFAVNMGFSDGDRILVEI